MKSFSIENLTENQLKTIIEALLFSASTGVYSNWCQNESEEALKLAIHLRKNNKTVLLENVFSFKDKNNFEDEYYDIINDFFPEIVEK